MRNKFIALFLCLCLAFPFHVSVSNADSDTYLTERIVFDDLMNQLEIHSNVTLSRDWRDWVLENWDSSDFCVVVLVDTNWNFSITTWHSTYSASLWAYQPNSPYGFRYIHTYENNGQTVYENQNPSTRNIQFKGQYVSRVSQAVTSDVYGGYTWDFTPDFQRSSLPSSGSRNQLAAAVNVSNIDYVENSDWKLYFNKDIYKLGEYDSPFYAHNLYKESWDILYELVVFNLGDRKYLTIRDQRLMRQLEPELWGYEFAIGFDYEDDYVYLTYNDTVLIPNAQYFITDLLQNVSPLGIYAFDVTEYSDKTIYWSNLFDRVEGEIVSVGYATNVPIDLTVAYEPTADITSWSEFITYINNYNLEPVVPQALLNQIFGTDTVTSTRVQVFGTSRWWSTGNPQISPPATVDTPFWSALNAGQGDVQGRDIWNLVDYSLLEIAVIPVEMGVSYSFDTYWYEYLRDTNIGDYTFQELFDMYDGVIIVPSNQDANIAFLYENYDITPGGVVSYNDPLCRCNIDFRIDYEDYLQFAHCDGYLFLNSKAIQKSQLLYFADGFRKFYDLMSDYIETESDWKASFLTFTSALYYKLDSMNGHLNNLDSVITDWFDDWGVHIRRVYDYFDFFSIQLDNIVDKLSQIVDNTDEQVHDFWILPVYNFIRQFKPSISGFANWIDAIEDTSENAPPLPVVSVPLLPTMGVQSNE